MADARGPLTGASITRRAYHNGPTTIDAINDFGNVTVYTYDGVNRQLRQEQALTASGSGNGTSIGASIEGVKNKAGSPDSFLPTLAMSQGGGDGIIRIGTTYDDNALVSSQIDDQGNVTLYLYDNLNRRLDEGVYGTYSLPSDDPVRHSSVSWVVD